MTTRRAPKSEREAVCVECRTTQALLAEILRSNHEISMRLQALSRERMPDAPAAIEEFCSAIHGVFCEDHFGAKWIEEVSSDPDQASVRLKNAVERLLGPKPSARKLAHFLPRSIGTFGQWRLMFHQERSREGNLFRVAYIA